MALVGLRLGFLWALLLTCGCNQPSSQRLTPFRLPSGQTLRVAAFPDYFSRAALIGFESRTGNKIVIETYRTNEELLERLQNGLRYDVVVPSGYAVELLIKEGKLQPMQREHVENLAHVPAAFRNPPFDPGLEHCIPYVWSLLGLGVSSRRNLPGHDLESWQALFAMVLRPGEPAPAQVMMLDDMRATMGVALKSLGRSANSRNREDIFAAEKLLLGQLPHVADYVDDPSLDLDSGAISLSLSWSTKLYDLMRRKREVRFVFPVEGTLLYIDYACVSKSSEHAEVAFAFLNHLLEPAVAAETTNTMMLATANQEARRRLDAEARAMWGAFEWMTHRGGRCEVLRDVGPAAPLYEEAWHRVKQALAAQKATSVGQERTTSNRQPEKESRRVD